MVVRFFLEILFLLLIGISFYTDLFKGRIYNIVTLPALILGLILNSSGEGLDGLKSSVLGMGAGLSFFLPLFVIRGVGGGDIKLIAAIGSIKGPVFVFWAVLYSWVVAGIMSFFVLLWTKKLGGTLKKIFMFFFSLFRIVRYPGYKVLPMDSRSSLFIPLGVAICTGSVIAWYLRK